MTSQVEVISIKSIGADYTLSLTYVIPDWPKSWIEHKDFGQFFGHLVLVIKWRVYYKGGKCVWFVLIKESALQSIQLYSQSGFHVWIHK